MPKFSPKQNEYIRKANHRWNLKIGAVRSGKSFVDIAFMIPWRLRQLQDKPGLNVILGVSKETIERDVLQPMREIYTDAIVGTINQRNIAIVCGVPVYCLGAEKVSQVSKIQGSSIKYCYGDEIAKWNQEVFEMLKSRLDKSYSCFDGACNPEYPGHWLKTFIDREDLDIYVQKYKIFDNPFLPPDFVKDLCKEYEGTVYYGRYINGEWTLAEGLIYPMYKEALVSTVPADVSASEHTLSIDYGTQNAFAAILYAKYNDVWYAIDEYYYSGRDTGAQKTDEEYAQDLDKWLSSYGFSNAIETIIDPSAASFITLLRKRGQRYKVRHANNDVADGIRETATALKTGKLKICECCKSTVKEIQGYVWDDKAANDVPVKVNDHAMDSMRYMVKTKRITKIKQQFNSVYL